MGYPLPQEQKLKDKDNPMAQQSGNNGRTGRSNGSQVKTPPPVQAPTVLAVTLPSDDEWDTGHYAILEPEDLPSDVILVALRAQDMHVSSTGKTVIRANAQFERIDRTNTLSLTLMRKATVGDTNNPQLVNPKNNDK